MKISAYRQAELDHLDTRPIKVACGFCDWGMEGTFKECREGHREHRFEQHPELERKRHRGRPPGYGLRSWGSDPP